VSQGSFETERPLKSVSTEQLETALAGLLTQIIGKEYQASVLSVDYHPDETSDSADRCELRLTVERKFDFPRWGLAARPEPSGE
jgi:hypothetical protein